MYILGIDPGPIPGIVRLQLDTSGPVVKLVRADALQVSHGITVTVLEALSDGSLHGTDQAAAYERFVVGPRASRSRTAHAGATTRNLFALVDSWATGRCRGIHPRSAADVKPWATDKRLAAAGLLEPLTTGMRHARDAARHALFCAVRDYGLPDPLSRAGGGA